MISEDRKRLFTTEKDGKKIGISLWEIMACLGYYKRDTNGQRNLGMIIKNAIINLWAKFRPIPTYRSDDPLTEDDRKSINYGFTIRGIDWNADLAKETSWETYTVGSSPQYRILDFDGYNKDAKCPMEFVFDNGKKVYKLNTTFGFDCEILVKYRLNDSLYSSDMADAELDLSDMKVHGVDIENYLDQSIPCVVAHKDDVGYRVANGIGPLSGRTSANIDEMKIDLSKYNIFDAAQNATSEDRLLVPSDATNVKSLMLYPKLNNYYDVGSFAYKYSDDDSTPFGNIDWTNKEYGNGFVNKRSNALIPVPDGSALKIIQYTFIPAETGYTYVQVYEDGKQFGGNFLFTTQNDLGKYGYASVVGQTLAFKTKKVEVTMLVTLHNKTDETIYVKPTQLSFLNFNTTNVALTTNTSNDYMEIAPYGNSSIYVKGTFEAGSYNDYTFVKTGNLDYGFGTGSVRLKFGNRLNKYGQDMLIQPANGAYYLSWK